jgi:hypothetical protein
MHGDLEFPMIDNLPLHWDLLTRRDLDDYVELRKSFYDEIRKSKKGERLESFIKRLIKIRSFVERGDQDDWKRSLVCGIIFMKNSIAIHIQQFRLLLGKCKSSINGSLQQIGFIAQPQGGPVNEELLDKIPIFRKENSDVKKWTVRDSTAKVNPLNTGETVTEKEERKEVVEVKEVKPEPITDADIVKFNMMRPINRPLYNVPMKFRMKYIGLIHTPRSIQTDA